MKIDNSSFERVGELKYLKKKFNKSKFYSGKNFQFDIQKN